VQGSRGEFTVAKDQNIRLRSGWFSDRAATYLASGRPVVTQETGFSNHLPTGRGLFAFTTMEEAIEAVREIDSDYAAHARAAADVAREHFAHDVVLPRLLDEAGVDRKTAARGINANGASAVGSLRIRDEYTTDYYLGDCGGYDAFQKTGGKRLSDGRLQAMALLADLKPGRRALDLGCGRGELTYDLASRGWEVTAIDYSRDALRLAEQCFTGEPRVRDRVRFRCDSVCTAPLDGPYDVALAADVVEHLAHDELECLYARVAEHLTPDGLFVVHTFPNLWFYRYGHPRRRAAAVAAATGVEPPSDPRSPYEKLMHINEQSPRVMRRQLRAHFPHVLLWFADPERPAGSLAGGFDREAMCNARDLFAIASHAPIDAAAVRARLESEALGAVAPGQVRFDVVVAEIDGNTLRAAQEFTAAVTVHNGTPFVLKSIPPHPVNLCYHWLHEGSGEVAVWDGERTPVLPRCAPGASGAYTMRVVAPPAPGRYVLRVTLVQEQVCWFDLPPIGAWTDLAFEVASIAGGTRRHAAVLAGEGAR
jgi:2-polyprenyl-3-methyl-5-hydroxy-6-metoxy-1,4-benzoquinol methylase